MGKRSRLTLPTGALQDTRLGARDLRVLGALCFFVSRQSGTSSPKRKVIAAWAGVSESHVSHATRRLESFGWVEKEGNGGRSSASVYRIIWGENGAEFSTVSDPKNSAKAGTVSEDETVPNRARFTAENGAENGTVSGNGAKVGRVSGETVPDSARFSTETVPNSAPATRARSSNNKYIYPDPDQIGSEKEEVSSSTQGPAFGEYVEVLTSHGMPAAWAAQTDTRKIIVAWRDAQVPIADLEQACARAADVKRDGPIGPKYVEQVLRSMMQGEKASETSRKPADGFNSRTDYREGAF